MEGFLSFTVWDVGFSERLGCVVLGFFFPAKTQNI